jgi:hypothetical protein
MGEAGTVSDLAAAAIQKMRAPSAMQIICIDVTNKCDLACSNCTRLLENQVGFWDMTPENFRKALKSLADFPGVIAVIGGNPCMHPEFPELCRIIAEEMPDKSKRGLWTNNFFKHRDLADRTFGFFNLNPHGDARGAKSLKPYKGQGRYGLAYHRGNSVHSPILTAVKDLFDEEKMWDRISTCDINQNWSASIVQNKGQLRAYFCEVSASFDLARGEDHGIEVVDGWWKKPIADFSGQIRKFCPGCGIPARIRGTVDAAQTDTFTASNRDIADNSLKNGRKLIELKSLSGVMEEWHKVTDYSETLQPKSPLKRFRRKVKKFISYYAGW